MKEGVFKSQSLRRNYNLAAGGFTKGKLRRAYRAENKIEALSGICNSARIRYQCANWHIDQLAHW
jgi:hypothetical protein